MTTAHPSNARMARTLSRRSSHAAAGVTPLIRVHLDEAAQPLAVPRHVVHDRGDVVVRGEERAPDKEARLPVVLGVDGAATSEASIEFAFDAAANRGVELVAVHAWHDVTVPFGYDPLGELPTISDEELNALDERLAGHLAGWAQKHPEVPVRRVVARGRPAPSLLEQAQQAQLVVVGSHGRGSSPGWSSVRSATSSCTTPPARWPSSAGDLGWWSRAGGTPASSTGSAGAAAQTARWRTVWAGAWRDGAGPTGPAAAGRGRRDRARRDLARGAPGDRAGQLPAVTDTIRKSRRTAWPTRAERRWRRPVRHRIVGPTP
ncbi:hypothetical protein GCM10010210_36320 [Pseudonocardia hydrocarbonoxydans]